jgi:pilus assembly protein Flp/PilA
MLFSESIESPARTNIITEALVKAAVRRLWKEEEGQDLTEYGLLLVLIALVAVAAMQTLGSAINNVFSNAASNLSAAT